MNSMKDQEGFNQQFVQIVKKYPIVYDDTDAGHIRPRDFDRAWLKIAEEVTKLFGEDNITVTDCRLRWKGLRSSFVRYRNKYSGVSGVKPYYLYDDMTFLDRFVRKRKSKQESPLQLKEEDDTSQTMQPSELIPIEIFEHASISRINSPILQNNPSPIDERIRRRLKRIKEKKHSFEERIVSCLENFDKPEPHNSDLEFFKGILPDISKFSPQQKRKLKTGVLKLIHDIMDEL